MSHPEQIGFFAATAAANCGLIANSKVLEVGSYDVNGSVRNLFHTASEYVGVDLDAGPGVDVVAYGHEVDHEDGAYDVALSGECFEHDQHWTATFENMMRMTRPGGLVAFTCASRGRPEHGTTRSDAVLSPGTQAQGLDHYRNLTAEDFEGCLPLNSWFSEFRFWYMPLAFDLYFAGVRAGNVAGRPKARLPEAQHVQRLKSLMPFPHKIVRAPLAALSRALPEARYQPIILPYWSTLIKLQDGMASGRYRRTPQAQ